MIIDFVQKIIQSKFGNKSQYKESNNEINSRCPICMDSKVDKTKARFYFNKNKNTFYCHNCGNKGNISNLITRFTDIEDVDYNGLKKYISNEVVSKFLNPEKSRIIKNEDEDGVDLSFPYGLPISMMVEHDIHKYLTRYEKKRYITVLKYLKSRGVTKDWYKYFYFTYGENGEKGEMDNYVLTLTKHGDDYIWSGRKINGYGPKYKHLPKFQWSKSLGFANEVSKNKSKTLYIVEGWFSALTLNQYGYNSVCVFGLQNMRYDHESLNPFKDAGYKLVWLPDNDGTFEDFKKINNKYKRSMFISMLPSKDANDMLVDVGGKSFNKLFDNIKPLSILSYELYVGSVNLVI